MVLVIDDKSKDIVLDELMGNINKAQAAYLANMNEPEVKAKYRDLLARLTMVYNQIIDKKISKLNGSMRRNLHVPGPQSELEKKNLFELIESV